MSRQDDELEGRDELSERQLWAVSRFEARAGRHHRDRYQETSHDRWARFHAAEDEEERRRFGPS